ncbi:15.4 kDa class V heat shock protein-like [Salvia splendens]|uniref:15.4 kDa class V heat shock protein-like n=1 Tax=Salvia splendens TaxID=180675 RepID=UPI001100F52E|nr:15.4 kDa class V heat shock protein-like [Salvia splendens]XP_042045304.1 15.4 kDa class V heat shock protein-like [Salvia splendens]
MEVAPFTYLFPSAHQFPPRNYVHWTQTPESHLYSADIPGVRKEEIKVEVEDSRYLIIRTEAVADRSFSRKFRLPERVDVEGISAEYVDGVLTVKVPRSYIRMGFFIDPPHTMDLTATAA